MARRQRSRRLHTRHPNGVVIRGGSGLPNISMPWAVAIGVGVYIAGQAASTAIGLNRMNTIDHKLTTALERQDSTDVRVEALETRAARLEAIADALKHRQDIQREDLRAVMQTLANRGR
jgi:hypothetical protein